MPLVQRAPGTSPVWLWISPGQVSQCSRSGTAWTNLKADADRTYSPVLWDQDDKGDTYILAGALVYMAYKHIATVDLVTAEVYRAKVQAGIEAAMPQLLSGPIVDDTALPLVRNVTPLVIAGSIIDWDSQAALDAFTAWCRSLLGTSSTPPFSGAFVAGDGRSISSTHEDRPNNWGTHAGAARLALAIFLREWTHVARCEAVFRGWLGEVNQYAGFQWGSDTSWHSGAPSVKIGVNPSGAVSPDGLARVFDGILPDDQRRVGPYPTQWGQKSNYTYEALQGIVTQAVLLARQGRTPWSWSSEAIRRAFNWLSTTNSQLFTDAVNGTDDYWMAWILDRVYGTTYVSSQSIPSPTSPGKSMGYADWTIGSPNWP